MLVDLLVESGLVQRIYRQQFEMTLESVTSQKM